MSRLISVVLPLPDLPMTGDKLALADIQADIAQRDDRTGDALVSFGDPGHGNQRR